MHDAQGEGDALVLLHWSFVWSGVGACSPVVQEGGGGCQNKMVHWKTEIGCAARGAW